MKIFLVVWGLLGLTILLSMVAGIASIYYFNHDLLSHSQWEAAGTLFLLYGLASCVVAFAAAEA